MLDDLKLINERDPSDALGLVQRQWQQLQKDFSPKVSGQGITNIVYSGMGGSALAALLSQSWPGYNLPFSVVRNYDIPDYVSEQTLFISSSYSGNTEETLNAVNQAAKKNARIVVISGGGKLTQLAQERHYPLAVIPDAKQPRYAVLYNLKALVDILEQADLIDGRKAQQEISSAVLFLKSTADNWLATVPQKKNQAKQIAAEATGKSIVIYAGPKLAPVAYKWKISFNENAKQIAWWNQYPEFNHNEFLGWSEQPVIKPYLVVDLKSDLEDPRILKRFNLSTKLLSGKRPQPIVVEAQGQNLLEHLLYTTMLGDFASIYLAILSGVNPLPVALMDKFKSEL